MSKNIECTEFLVKFADKIGDLPTGQSFRDFFMGTFKEPPPSVQHLVDAKTLMLKTKTHQPSRQNRGL